MISKTRSLRSVLLQQLLFASLVPLLLLLIAVMILFNNYIRDSVFTENTTISAAVTREIDTFLLHVDSVGKWVASQTSITQESPEVMQNRLQSTVLMFGAFESLHILDAKGNVLATSPVNSNLIGSNQSGQDYFLKVSSQEQVIWSNTFISPYTGEPTVAVAFPMAPGYLVGHIQLKRLSHIGTQTSSAGKIELVITNSQGNLLVHPNRQFVQQQKNILDSEVVRQILDGKTGTLETVFEGREVLCSASLIDTTNWAVLVMQSKRSAFALLRGMILSLMLLMLLAGGLSIALAYYSRRRIVKPIAFLMENIRQIADGNYRPLEPEGKNYREIQYVSSNMVHMAEQIAEREAELKRNLHEKEVLVKEVHHRVKNNLQLVLSILNLKYASLREESVKNAMYDNIGRIYTIAQVHEQLYSSRNLAEIDLSTYLPSLLAYLLTLEKYIDYHIETDLEVEEILLHIEQAIPLGLIMFELISNSLQHGFAHDLKGRIWLKCCWDADTVKIDIADNGKAFDPNLFRKAESVGFSIIHELVRQLHGSIAYENLDGNLFSIIIPMNTCG